MDNQNTTELPALNKLEAHVQQSTAVLNNSFTSLQAAVSNNLDLQKCLNQLSHLCDFFIAQQLSKSGLKDEIELVNVKVHKLLDEIKFFSNNTSYISGFFSTSFSSEDNNNWVQIEELLDSIYNTETGQLKKAQNLFLFLTTREQLCLLVKKELSWEEELYLRGILITSYLKLFRQLILPFYEIDDSILIRYKQKRIQELKRSEKVKEIEEIQLLEDQIIELKNFNSQQQLSDNKFKKAVAGITQSNQISNIWGVATATAETVRYLTSAIGHKTGVTALQTLGKLGLTASTGILGFIGRCIPFVSVAVDLGTQMNNNRIIYNYEKQLKTIAVIDVVKRNLLILEQQLMDYFIHNILIRFQEVLIQNQLATTVAVQQVCQHQVTINLQDQKKIDCFIQNVRIEHRKKVEAIRVDTANEYEEVIQTKNEKLVQKDDEISVRDTKLKDLDEQIRLSQNNLQRLEKEKTTFTAQAEKQASLLKQSLQALERQRNSLKDELAREKETLQLQEQSFNEVLKGKVPEQLQLLYRLEKDKKNEALAHVSVLVEKNRINEDKAFELEVELESVNKVLTTEKDYWEGYKEQTEYKYQQLRSENEKLYHTKQALAKESDKFQEELGRLKAEQVISTELKRQLDFNLKIEVEKTTRLYSQLDELSEQVNELTEQKLENDSKRTYFQNLEHNNMQKQKNIELLDSENNKLRTELASLKANSNNLANKNFWLKAKLTTVLVLDTCRFFLPQSVGNWITATEATLLAENSPELSMFGKSGWLLVILAVILSTCYSFFRVIKVIWCKLKITPKRVQKKDVIVIH